MATYSWTTGENGDWNTAADWSPNGLPGAGDDVTIDAPATSGAYTVTIAAGESETVNSLTMNGVNNLAGANSNPYTAAELEVDGTLTFAGLDGASSAGLFGGSLQTFVVVNGGTIVNAGTVDALVQATGSVLFTGTNGIYFTNELQALGTATVDTQSIAEIAGNTLFDGTMTRKAQVRQ